MAAFSRLDPAAVFQWLARPKTAVMGCLAAMLIWTAIGVVSILGGDEVDRSAKAPKPNVAESNLKSDKSAEIADTDGADSDPPENSVRPYVAWKSDYLGHFLLLAAAIVAALMWYCHTVIRSINGACRERIDARVKKWLRWAGPPITMLCVAYVVMNALYVSNPDTPVVHWQHRPWWLPWVVAGNFYLLATLPLMLNIVAHGVALLTTVEHCDLAIGFDCEEPRFGIGLLGDMAAVGFLALMLFMLPPVLIQSYAKGDITLMSYVSVDIGLLAVFHLSLRPLLALSVRLGKEKAALLERLIRERSDYEKQLEKATGDNHALLLSQLQSHRQKLAAAHQLQTFPITWQTAAGTLGGLAAIIASSLQVATLLVEQG